MKRGGGCPLFLFLYCLSFSPTVSQAVEPSGCQWGNKVTGWWARRPLSDHMDWCCARHHSHWLTQQGSSHKRGTYSRPEPFMLFLSSFFALSVSVYFSLSHLLVRLFLPSVPLCSLSVFTFPNTCFLSLPVLFKCYGGESDTSEITPLFTLLFFLNCSLKPFSHWKIIPLTPINVWRLSSVGKSTIRINSWVKWLCSSDGYVSNPTLIGSDGNMALWWKFRILMCKKPGTVIIFYSLCAISAVKPAWYRHTQAHTWRMSSTAIFLQTYNTFVSTWHPLLHTALTALIYTESNPLRCVYETTIFLFYE